MSTSERLDLRVKNGKLAQIRRAAELTGETTTEFVRGAAEARADQVLREHEATTRVPIEFFDELWVALDTPAQPNAALAAAGERLRGMADG